MPGPPCRFRGDGARRPTGDVDGGSEKVQMSRLPVSPPARPVVVEIMPSVLHDCARAPPHSPARRARRASPCSPRIGVRFTGARASRCSADAKPEQPACGPLGRFRPRRRDRCLTASPGGRCPPRQSRAGDAGAPLRRRTRRPDAPPASEDGGAPPSSPSRSGPVRRHRRAPPPPPSFPAKAHVHVAVEAGAGQPRLGVQGAVDEGDAAGAVRVGRPVHHERPAVPEQLASTADGAGPVCRVSGILHRPRVRCVRRSRTPAGIRRRGGPSAKSPAQGCRNLAGSGYHAGKAWRPGFTHLQRRECWQESRNSPWP